MLNTLGVRSALGEANRRKLSFRNVSNVVVQLLHTIKYSVPAPFSHLATTGYQNDGNSFSEKNTRQVSWICGDFSVALLDFRSMNGILGEFLQVFENFEEFLQ